MWPTKKAWLALAILIVLYGIALAAGAPNLPLRVLFWSLCAVIGVVDGLRRARRSRRGDS